MKSLLSPSKLIISLSLCATLVGCAHHANAPIDAVQSDAVSSSACENNAYLKQYGCSLQRVEQAAETNEPDAEYALGYMYYNGIGTVKDPETAEVWIKRAAQQGQPLAISAMRAIEHAQFPQMGQVSVRAQAQTKTPPQPTAAPGVVPTNSAGPLGSIKKLPSNHYTVQLFASPNLHSVTQLQQQLPDVTSSTIAAIHRNGQVWYLLLAGNFASHQQAAQYVQTLPAKFQSAKPWIRSFAALQGLK